MARIRQQLLLWHQQLFLTLVQGLNRTLQSADHKLIALFKSLADLLAQFIILFGISSIFGCQSRLWFIATFEHVISWQVFLAHNGAIKQSKKGCQQHERLLLLTVFPYRG